jgi:hypothetical protein
MFLISTGFDIVLHLDTTGLIRIYSNRIKPFGSLLVKNKNIILLVLVNHLVN